jgi:exosome complex exonuclease RRP6
MLQELKAAKEIAVDLEHHDLHTYTGIVCLMQISTREKDWIVDTLKPWREKLQVLNEVFTDPKILKVFHGSASDMVWLQRDLGLYVVGLFDTFYACDALSFPGRGLKYLLQRFAGFEAQKQYQLSDWRQRPLGPELIDYARSDTHYLLYIYDEVRNLLVENSTENDNLVDRVLAGSKKESLQKYERFKYDFESGRGSGGWFGLFVDRNINFSPQQFAVYKALHQWRDEKARELDESPHYLMKQTDLFAIAEAMPKNMTALYKCSRPQLKFAQTEFAPEIFPVVAKAMDESKDDPPVHEQIRQNELKYGERPQNRWRKPQVVAARQPTGFDGVAATLKQLHANGDLDAAPIADVQMEGNSTNHQAVMRSQQSDLWGPVMPFMGLPFMDPMMNTMALNYLLPLPDLSANAFSMEQPAAVPAQNNQVPIPATTSLPSTPNNNSFTLHDRSTRKRKAEDVLDDDNESADPFANQSLNGITDTEAMVYAKPGQGSAAMSAERALTKSERKAEKRARRAADDEEKDRKAREMVPFDYDLAEPMLNGSPTASNGVGQASKGKKPHMNPFAKALDTGTGARRNKLGQEGAGKSMTFRS